MNNIQIKEMSLIQGGNCLARGFAAPFAVVFSGFIPSDTLDSFWNNTIDECF